MKAKSAALAVANPVTRESSNDIWKRWSDERAERDRRDRLRHRAMAKAETEEGIYHVEIARLIAQHHGQAVCPEWRYLRDLIGRQFSKILHQQPEMRERDVKAREKIVTALFEALPLHLRPALMELRTLLELVTVARESTTALIMFEMGRASGFQQAIRDPRVQLAPMADRKLLAPAPRQRDPLRLHDGTEEGGAR